MKADKDRGAVVGKVDTIGSKQAANEGKEVLCELADEDMHEGTV